MSGALITGGAGFLGRNLAASLIDTGEEVTVLDDLSSNSPLGVPEDARLVVGNVIDPPDLGGPFARVYHLASPASPPRYIQRPVETLRTSAEGTRRMLDLAEQWRARFILASTSEIYGDPAQHPQQEEYVGAVSVTSARACYDEAKRYAEALVYAYRRAGRVTDSRVVRIFNTYGEGMDPDDGRVVSNFLVQALKREPLTIYGDGSQTRSFCYVDDLVDGVIRLADSEYRAPINIGMPVETTISELADLVAAEVGDTGRVSEDLPEGDPVRRCPDISRAETELGWTPRTDLATGLARTAEYFRSLY